MNQNRQRPKTPFEKEIESWQKNEAAQANYNEAIALLQKSGLVPILRRLGAPNFVNGGTDAQSMAAQAAFSSGYHTSLEHVIYFNEIFKQQPENVIATPTYGGIEEAIRRGDLTRDEADKLV